MKIYLPLLKVGEIKLTEEYFLEEIILENISVRWQKECDLKGIDETNNWAEVQAFLIKREEHLGEIQAHLTDRNPRNSSNPNSRAQTQGNEQGKGKDNNKKKIANPCKLPNHQHHEWKDSFNNLRSTNFKGTAKTPKDFNNDGSKRRERREEEQILEGNSEYFKLSNSYDIDSEVDDDSIL